MRTASYVQLYELLTFRYTLKCTCSPKSLEKLYDFTLSLNMHVLSNMKNVNLTQCNKIPVICKIMYTNNIATTDHCFNHFKLNLKEPT